MSERYRQARQEYEAEMNRVKTLCGISYDPQPYDFTGAFVFEEHAWKLLENPTKTEAAKIYEELLDYAVYSGWDIHGAPYFPP